MKVRLNYMEDKRIHTVSKKSTNLRVIMDTNFYDATKRGPGEVTESLGISTY